MTTTKQLINRFIKYELIVGILCILIPFIYVWLLTMGGILITVVGIRQNKPLMWVMGIFLLIVPLAPFVEFPIIHFTSAGIFFLGVVIDIIIDTQRLFKYRWVMVGVIISLFIFHFFLNLISLFWVESILIIIFGINLLLDLIHEKKDL